jgi:lysophospholipase L1-like esterase
VGTTGAQQAARPGGSGGTRRLLSLGAAAVAAAAVTGLALALALPTAPPVGAEGSLPAPAPVVPATQALAPGSAWVATWTAGLVGPAASGQSATGFHDQTVRQVVHISVGGGELRLRLSNADGTAPLEVGAATVAEVGTPGGLAAGTTRPLLVGGAPAFSVPAGLDVTTDPVGLPVPDGADLAVSLYVPASGPATWHPMALTTGYVSAGDHASDPTAASFPGRTSSWWWLAGVDVVAPVGTRAVVAFGASTTDGEGSTANADRRWVDDLNHRLESAATGPAVAVVDQGISGNRLLAGGGTAGASGDDRFPRDAVSEPGVTSVFVSSLGNDDIGAGGAGPATADDLIAGYERLISLAHAAGLRIVGATLTPDEGAGFWTRGGEVVRQQVNHWILTSGAFDATVDLAGIVADPTDPARLAPAFDSGDHLHLNDAGYAAVAAAIPVTTLVPGAAPAA